MLEAGVEEDGTSDSSPDEHRPSWESQLRTTRWMSSLAIVLALVSATALAVRWPASAVDSEAHLAPAGVIELSDARSLPKRRGHDDDAEAQIEQGAAAFAARLFDPSGGEDDDDHPVTDEAKKAKPLKHDLAEDQKKLLDSLAVTGDGWYRVNINSVVRSGHEMNSSKVSVAPAGIFVHVAERKGRRVRVDKAASTLERSKVVQGWMSSETADGRLQILRPSKQAALLDGTHNITPGKLAMIRAQYDKDAVRIAQVTAYQKQLTDNLHKVNVTQVAHGLVQFGKNREKFEEQGIKTAQKAGEHVGESLERGANSILNALDGWTGHLDGDDKEGKKESSGKAAVGEISIPLPQQDMMKSIFNTFKEGLENANVDKPANKMGVGAHFAGPGR